MKRTCMRTGLVAAAFGVMLAGCATTVEMGPGYYHWDTHAVDLSSTHTARTSEPKVAYGAAPAVREGHPIDRTAEVAPAPGAPAM